MSQISLNSGIILEWNKSFDCEGGIGQDAVQLMNEALHRRGILNVRVTAILNDTTGEKINYHAIP